MVANKQEASGWLVQLACEAGLPADRKPVQVFLAHWGENKSANGTFIVDDEAWDAMRADFAEQARDLVIDFEHQTLAEYNTRPDGKAPAAGWITALTAVKDGPKPGIYATVNWTDDGWADLDAGSYRYISPTLLIHKKTRRAVALVHAGLTNAPAIRAMSPVAYSERLKDMSTKDKTDVVPHVDPGATPPSGSRRPDGSTSDNPDSGKTAAEELLMKLAEALGLPPDTPLADVLSAALAAVTPNAGDQQPSTEPASVRTALGLQTDADTEAVVNAIRRAKAADVTDELRAAREELATFKVKQADTEYALALKAATDSGKLTPSMVEKHGATYRAMFTNDRAGFDALMDTLNVVVPQGRTIEPTTDKEAAADRRAEKIAVHTANYEQFSSKIADLDAYVNQCLREEGLSPLTATEIETLTA